MRTWRRFSPGRILISAIVLSAAAAGLFWRADELPAQQTPADGHIIVEGRVLYIDRNSDMSHAAAGLKIEIWDIDDNFPSVGEKLDETVTDASGFFKSDEILNEDPDNQQMDKTQDIYVKLFTDNGDVRLYKTGTTQEYWWNGYEIDLLDGIQYDVPDGVVSLAPLYVMENTKNAEALWTFVNMADAWYYMQEMSGQEPGQVTGYWERRSNEGPHYNRDEKALYFRGGDAGYGDIIVQQTAYALIDNLLGASVPAAWADCFVGPEELKVAASTPACAFVQGFASFLPLAVYEDPKFEAPAVGGLDLDMAKAGSAGWEDGDAVPGRIAGAFWDLFESDETEDGTDATNSSAANIWSAIVNHNPSTMAEWWTAYKAEGHDACDALGSLFQNTIDYNAAPQIVDPIPDIVLKEDETIAVDLRDYVTDTECAGERLQFRLIDAGEREAGVQFVPTSVISVTPQANWFGQTIVKMEVSDGVVTLPMDILVVVQPVNDCPTIDPRINDPAAAKFEEPLILSLGAHGRDVEDLPTDLRWALVVEDKDKADVDVQDNGLGTFTVKLITNTITAYSIRVKAEVTDRDGCSTEQPLVLRWDRRPNFPPAIIPDSLTKEYFECQGNIIKVDLEGVATDDEDGPLGLQWFVDNQPLEHANVIPDEPKRQSFQFIPKPLDYSGDQRVDLRVEDSGGLSARATITLTWKSAEECANLPPRILRNRLKNKTAGLGANVCYDLFDKAIDPDNAATSLRWFTEDANLADVTVTGEGTRRLCLRPSPRRRNQEFCVTPTFIVADPFNAEDSHPVTTCWRDITIRLPYTNKGFRTR